MELRLDSASDQAILTALRRRRLKSAAELMVQSYSQVVFSACQCAVADKSAAEELTYESFSSAFGALSEFRAEGSPGRWLLEVAFDRCDIGRSSFGEASTERTESDASRAALAQLSSIERAAVAMAFRFGVARSVVAERLGEPLLDSALDRACELFGEGVERESLGAAIQALEWRVGEALRRRLDALCAALPP